MELEPKFPTRMYYDIPHLTVREYVELVRALMPIRLRDGPMELDALAEELEICADKAAARLEALGEDYDLAEEARQVAFEDWTDSLASTIEGALTWWQVFVNPLVRESKKKAGDDDSFEADLEKAARGRAIHESMFGAGGYDYLRMSYEQRFGAVAAMFRTLAKDDLDGNFEELMEGPLAKMTGVLGEAYELRRAEHLRTRDERDGLAKHRAALRWALAAYVHEVGQQADRWSQESCDRVNATLMPLVEVAKAHGEKKKAEREAREAEREAEKAAQGKAERAEDEGEASAEG